MVCLLSYYELCRFSEYVTIVSLTKPFGNMLYKALGVDNTTLHELVCLCIFGMRNWTAEHNRQPQGGNI